MLSTNVLKSRRLTTASRACPRRLSLLQNDFRVGCACYNCRHGLVNLAPESFTGLRLSILSTRAFLSWARANDFGCRHALKSARTEARGRMRRQCTGSYIVVISLDYRRRAGTRKRRPSKLPYSLNPPRVATLWYFLPCYAPHVTGCGLPALLRQRRYSIRASNRPKRATRGGALPGTTHLRAGLSAPGSPGLLESLAMFTPTTALLQGAELMVPYCTQAQGYALPPVLNPRVR